MNIQKHLNIPIEISFNEQNHALLIRKRQHLEKAWSEINSEIIALTASDARQLLEKIYSFFPEIHQM